MKANKFAYWIILIAISFSQPAQSETVRVAVATNFLGTAENLASDFESSTGHQVILASGSTGQLFAQIQRGAPFEILLAADEATPARLEKEGFAVLGSRFAYAIGQLVLWSPRANSPIRQGPQGLLDPRVRHVALPNPRLAPYGSAARAALEHLGLWTPLEGKIVFGQNVAQTFSLLAAGAASAGFIAKTQRETSPAAARGVGWPVPPSLHPPIIQEAVLLKTGRTQPGARAFLDYLQGEPARRRIRAAGYGTPPS
ncbi:MAG: molybdate ABC transporter substrate-binding protein [bacterium TMED88]|nr:molybdate ABC transporter substrate-binding protein [Deltaproteobacteria bacterium]OUV25756.1 MAG: molybdate ABC transporter substrate-binding protein [bacterium TMED88]